MDRERLAWTRALGVAADAVLLTALWVAVIAVRASVDWPGVPPLPAEIGLPLGWLFVPVWLVAARLGEGASERPVRDVLRGVGIAALAAVVLLFLARIDANRSVVVGFAALSVPALLARRAASEAAVRWSHPHRVVVVGTDDELGAARPLLAALARRPGVVVALRPPDPAGLLAELEARPVEQVHLLGAGPPERLASVARICDELGVPLSIDANFLGLRTTSVELTELDGGWTAITFRQGAPSPTRAAKRALDLAGALAATILLAPVFGAAALLVALLDGRPVVFRQQRIGRYGRPFTMFKLRTMVRGAELAAPPPGASKPLCDPRITPLGRVLRRLSIDELPQLVNVLRGEMSLVGPRPPLPAEVARYERWERRRLSVRPGMTGLWQVSGRADLPRDQGTALDLQYVDRWSLWLDVVLLARTVPAVLSGTGAR
jgi:exopolysaccharide biosynthesis polyprenyl glycosylphosphotransferase